MFLYERVKEESERRGRNTTRSVPRVQGTLFQPSSKPVFGMLPLADMRTSDFEQRAAFSESVGEK